MFMKRLLQHATVALSVVAFSSLSAVSVASAQAPFSPVVRVESPNTGTRVNGTVTFTGLAVDCTSGQAATRVAVLDGPDNLAPYLADVSMDTNRNLSDACQGRSGSARIGFTLIMDSNRLIDGTHPLTFVAHFANGRTQSTTIDVVVDNLGRLPHSSRYTGYYGGTVVTQCTAWNSWGVCIGYRNVIVSPVVTGAYPGCVPNGLGGCMEGPSYRYGYNPYTGTPVLLPGRTYSGQAYWNGYTWVLR